MAAAGNEMPQATLRCTHIEAGLDRPARSLILVPSNEDPAGAAHGPSAEVFADVCADCAQAFGAATQWDVTTVQSGAG